MRQYKRFGYAQVRSPEFLGKPIDIGNIDLDQLEEEVIQKQKNIFLQQHLEIFKNFIEHKKKDGICVIKTVDEHEFITCDNPVIIRKYVFDPSNEVNLPINNKYQLLIHPKEDWLVQGAFTRISGQLTNVLAMNREIELGRDRWIIGSERSITNHLHDQKLHNEPTAANAKMSSDLNEKAILLSELNDILLKNRGEITENYVSKLKEASQDRLLKDDPNILRFVQTLRKKGFNI